jgi:hypothetical protein
MVGITMNMEFISSTVKELVESQPVGASGVRASVSYGYAWVLIMLGGVIASIKFM